jgi:hypothetical protein
MHKRRPDWTARECEKKGKKIIKIFGKKCYILSGDGI